MTTNMRQKSLLLQHGMNFPPALQNCKMFENTHVIRRDFEALLTFYTAYCFKKV
jgi:hypothetical protein